MRLVLFDIDGTLLSAGRQVGPLFAGALEEVFGTQGDLYGYDFAGRTDPEIVFDLMQGAGLSEARVEEGIGEMKERYAQRLEAGLLREKMRLFPGVEPLLRRLALQEDVVLGLLTGNWEVGARIKLSRFDLNQYFSFGGFGDDGRARADLVPRAIARAASITGAIFEPQKTLIIGDTPRDVACAQAHGVPVVAVATGTKSAKELHSAGADWVVEDLTQLPAAIDWLA